MRRRPLLFLHNVVKRVAHPVGPATSLVVVFDMLQNSALLQLIVNSQWWYSVRGIALISIIVAGLLTMGRSSQIAWKEFRSG